MEKDQEYANCWHTDEPQTEAAWFERIYPGKAERVLFTGAFSRRGPVYIPSFAAKESEDLLVLHYLELSGQVRRAEIRKGNDTVFSDTLSLAWLKE